MVCWQRRALCHLPITQGTLLRLLMRLGEVTSDTALAVLAGVTAHVRHRFWSDSLRIRRQFLARRARAPAGHRRLPGRFGTPSRRAAGQLRLWPGGPSRRYRSKVEVTGGAPGRRSGFPRLARRRRFGWSVGRVVARFEGAGNSQANWLVAQKEQVECRRWHQAHRHLRAGGSTHAEVDVDHLDLCEAVSPCCVLQRIRQPLALQVVANLRDR